LALLSFARSGWAAPDLPSHARDQIRFLQEEKLSRTPAQKKLDSQLIYGRRERRQGFASRNVTSLRPALSLQEDGRVLVDITAEVTPALLASIEQRGGTIVSSFERYRAIRALFPLDEIEALAAQPLVRAIRPADQAIVNTALVSYEGVVAHQVDLARSTFGADGTGVKVGVLSDSVDS
jgi:hypothetical protein